MHSAMVPMMAESFCRVKFRAYVRIPVLHGIALIIAHVSSDKDRQSPRIPLITCVQVLILSCKGLSCTRIAYRALHPKVNRTALRCIQAIVHDQTL
jgi:hypothetical protein